MAKFYDRTDKELGQQVIRVPEDIWFEDQQFILLQLANTDYGKDLLCIPREYKNIFKIGKNHILHNRRF